MAMCEMCGKTKQTGNNVSHSKVATKRLFRPNIQKATIMVNGRMKQQKVCARCLKTLAKNPRGIK